VACKKDYLRPDVTIMVSSAGLPVVPTTIPSSLQDEASEAVSNMRGWKIICSCIDMLFATPRTLVVLTIFSQGFAGAIVPVDAVLVFDTQQSLWTRYPRQSVTPSFHTYV
jgi:hypothetical protein